MRIHFSEQGAITNAGAGQLLASYPAAMGADAPADGFAIPLATLSGNRAVEQWFVDHEVDHHADGELQVACSENYLALRISRLGALSELQQNSEQIYDLLLGELKKRGFPYILKCWNFVPGINAGEGDSENYKQFCIGRANAFNRAGAIDTDLPAGTAVGSKEEYGLSVYLLASKRKPVAIENPLQVSAYRYPRQYGPKSPSFSRATRHQTDSHELLFLSGTAAIKGHQSCCVNDGIGQLREMRTNVEAVLAQADMPPLAYYGQPGHGSSMRLFVRASEHQQSILEHFPKVFPELGHTLRLEADICRSDLLVELDGVLWATQLRQD